MRKTGFWIAYLTVSTILSLSFIFFASCSCENTSKERIDNRVVQNPTQVEITKLKQRIKDLELFAGTYASTTVNPFSDCDTLTIPLEKKICQIAKAANDNQRAGLMTQMATLSKEFQKTLYGDDCYTDVTDSCPMSSSILGRMSKAEDDLSDSYANILEIEVELGSIKNNINSLTDRMTSVENRLNKFNGTNSSIETVISGIQADIVLLKNDVAEIKGIISENKLFLQYMLCENNPEVGPFYEVVAFSTDKTIVYSYDNRGGMSILFTAGDTDVFKETSLSTRKCNYKLYNNNLGTKVQACWLHTNRNVTEAALDSARDLGTATCTQF